jgi:WD40 repeat protein
MGVDNMIAEPCLNTHNDPVRNVAFTADSRWLYSGDDSGLLVLSSVPAGNRIAAWRCHQTSISAIAVAPELGSIVTAAVDGSVRAWKMDPGNFDRMELVTETTFNGEISGLSFRPPDQTALAISVSTGEVALWQPYNTGSLAIVRRLPAQANSVAWAPDGSRLAVGCDDCLLYQFDLANRRTAVFRGHRHHVDQVAYSCCGLYLASGSHDRTVRVWQAATGHCIAVLPHRLDSVQPDWAQDGRLVTCSYDKRIRIWQPLTSELLAEIREHQYDVDDVAWSPDNRWIASGGWDHTVRLYDGADYRQVALIGGTRNQIYALAVDSARRRFFAGTAAGKLYEVSLDNHSGEPKLLPGLHDGPITSVDLSPDGKILASTGADSKLTLRVVDEWEVKGVTSTSHGLDLEIARFSPDGRRLAVGARDNSVTIYRVEGVLAEKVFQVTHERRVKALAWSNTNGLLATGADGNVRIFDQATGELHAQWRAHERMINAINWSADGELIATACWDRLVRVFRTDGRLLHELAGHQYNVNCVEFSSAGVIATGGWEGTTGFWDATSGQLLGMVSLPEFSPVHVLRWLPEDNTILAALWSGLVVRLRSDGTIMRTWDLKDRSASQQTNWRAA